MSSYPYQDRFPVNRTLPEHGRPRDEVLAEMRALAAEEDASWEGGRVSGTMYCGDHDHYSFMNDVFGLYAHVNILQRDICPSATRYEGEVIAMALDLMHADAVTDGEPVGLVTSGGTGSICHAVLAFREVAREERGVTRPNFIKPETGHPAFDKACHLFGIEMRHVPVDPVTMQADVEAVRAAIDDQTIGFMGSACNYGYGTIDPIEALSDLAVETGLPLHVDGCLGGFILPFGEELGFDIPPFDFRHPGVTSISADTHKYGYAFKGTSTVLFRDKRWRNSQYFFLTDWTGGKYCSPGMDGSRSGGLLAATWAAMVQLGREGYRSYAEQIFETSKAMQEAVRRTPSCASWATRRSCSASRATSSTSTTSTTSCGRRAGASTASSTPTPCTWRSPGPRPRTAWWRRSPTTWRQPSSTPRRRATSPPPRAPSTAAWPAA
ncbi:MAG: pyridoxal-dependent decarboxylase [Acidimicrobiales bacterium]